MALYSARVQQIRRSSGRSIIAAAAYRSGERLRDERQGITHDYSRRSGVTHKELILPDNAPAWARNLSRESFWNMVDARERRKDATTAREMYVMIPRELDPPERIRLVREFAQRNMVARGMVADVCWHDKVGGDGQSQPHAHILMTQRRLEEDGFGKKVRHDWVPDPAGRVHPNGRPVMIESNPDSWNSSRLYAEWRLDWERLANAALERAGSAERIDRRSYRERGIPREPEPALRLAYHLQELRGVMVERWGQWQAARLFREVEQRAHAALERYESDPTAPGAAQRLERYHAWFDRQIDRLAPEVERDGPAPFSPPLDPER